MSHPSGQSATSSSETRLSWLVAVSVVVLLAFTPQVASLGRRMWATDHYSFFPLILLGSAVLAWQRYRRHVEARPGPIWDAGFRSLTLWTASVLLLASGVLAHSPWLGGIGFLLAIRAMITSLFVPELCRRIMPAWWFLWLAVPLPLNLDRQLILGMQLLATKLASGVLDLGGVRHSLSGVVIEVPGKAYFVEEACSGIQSLFAAVSVTIFYSLLGRRGVVRTLALAALGIVWVLAANALRIISVTVLSSRYHIPIDIGLAHEATGAAVFVLALLMIVSTDRFLLYLAPLKRRSAFDHEAPTRRRRRRSRPVGSRWTVPVGVAGLLLFGGLGFLQFSRAVAREPSALNLPRGNQIVDSETLPKQWNGWEQTGFRIIERKANDPNGQMSRIWQYSRSGQSVSFSLDGPFAAWHDLGLCYASQGWTVDDEQDHTTHTDDGVRYHFSELTQENLEGQHAYVAFSAFDELGRRVSPPPFFRLGVGMRFPDATILLARVKESLSGDNAKQYRGRVYQTQAFVSSDSSLTGAEKQVVVELFLQLTSLLREDFSARMITADEAETKYVED